MRNLGQMCYNYVRKMVNVGQVNYVRKMVDLGQVCYNYVRKMVLFQIVRKVW